MSLEAKIEELIAAVNANTEAQKAANAANEKAITAYNSSTPTASAEGDGEKRGRGRPKKDEAAEPAKKDEPKSEPAKTETKAADVGDDAIRTVFGGFMSVDDADERESRKDFVKGLLKTYGAAKALEIPADKRAEAVEKVKAEGERRSSAGEDDLV